MLQFRIYPARRASGYTEGVDGKEVDTHTHTHTHTHTRCIDQGKRELRMTSRCLLEQLRGGEGSFLPYGVQQEKHLLAGNE